MDTILHNAHVIAHYQYLASYFYNRAQYNQSAYYQSKVSRETIGAHSHEH